MSTAKLRAKPLPGFIYSSSFRQVLYWLLCVCLIIEEYLLRLLLEE